MNRRDFLGVALALPLARSAKKPEPLKFYVTDEPFYQVMWHGQPVVADVFQPKMIYGITGDHS